MADSALSALTATTTLTSGDLLYVVDGGNSRKVDWADVLMNLSVTESQISDLGTYQVVLTEGAFVDGDKTKLDNIEAGADVTDTANVTAAGALMESEVTNLSDVKAFDPADYASEADVETATINAQTGTAYTLALTDRGQILTMDNASANTATVPTNATVAFDVGSVVTVIQRGAGATTITGDTGVTVNGTSAGSVSISAQYQGVSLLKVATDEWIASGAI